MKIARNRMIHPATRVAVPVEHVIVQPPPEAIIKCPDCGAARIKGWHVVGGRPDGGHRKRCVGCGHTFVVSSDGKSMRRLG